MGKTNNNHSSSRTALWVIILVSLLVIALGIVAVFVSLYFYDTGIDSRRFMR